MLHVSMDGTTKLFKKKKMVLQNEVNALSNCPCELPQEEWVENSSGTSGGSDKNKRTSASMSLGPF